MAGLTAEQRGRYEEEGYLVFERLLDPAELRPVIAEMEEHVDRLARAYHAEGRIADRCEGDSFRTRLIALCRQCPEMYGELTGSLHIGPATFELLRHPVLVDIAESIVGPEVHCQGRYRFRPKLPGLDAADFRWHEDTIYQAKRAFYVEQQHGLGPEDPGRSGSVISRMYVSATMPEPGFWLPLVDVGPENGCLQVLPGSHRHAPPWEEEARDGRSVAQLEGLRPVPVPLPVGGAILIHQHCTHVSPSNRSDHIRWSVDIRYQDGRRPVKSAREPGFLARSRQRPDEVVTTLDGYLRIREAAAAYARTPGIRL
jgi:phytanoyl-CoA hydroxylase